MLKRLVLLQGDQFAFVNSNTTLDAPVNHDVRRRDGSLVSCSRRLFARILPAQVHPACQVDPPQLKKYMFSMQFVLQLHENYRCEYQSYRGK